MAWQDAVRTAITELGDDCLSAVVHGLVYADVVSALSPFGLEDRGRALERAWKRTLRGALDIELEKLRKSEEQGLLPSLVFSPMLVEDGRRLLVTNLDLGELAQNQGRAVGPVPWRSRSEIELQKLCPKAASIKLSTAARMSASFPFVSPAA